LGRSMWPYIGAMSWQENDRGGNKRTGLSRNIRIRWDCGPHQGPFLERGRNIDHVLYCLPDCIWFILTFVGAPLTAAHLLLAIDSMACAWRNSRMVEKRVGRSTKEEERNEINRANPKVTQCCERSKSLEEAGRTLKTKRPAACTRKAYCLTFLSSQPLGQWDACMMDAG
jgi:hypothetical protein